MKLNLASDLFLGVQELNKWQKAIQDQGYLKILLANSISFGLIDKDIVDGNWTNFRVTQGTNAGTIAINNGFAIDSTGNLISYLAKDNISIPDDSLFKWIKISYQTTNQEIGTVSINQSGVLSGVGTKFTEVLRGGSNNPTKLSFINSVSNIFEYFVTEVISDTEAILAGDFNAESNINYAVIGSFTPDIVTPSGSKYPYVYDSVFMQLVPEIITNTAPASIAGQEFFIARIKRTGSAVTIEDKRNLNVYRDKADYKLSSVGISNNPLIGVEQITYNGVRTTRSQNIVQIGFGFRSSNWTINSGSNTVTLLGGNGGKYITTADYQTNDFTAFRVYTEDGRYSLVKQSSIAALQINLILDTLNPDSYNSNLIQELHVVPDVDGIELIAKPIGSQVTEKRFYFPINEGYVKIPLDVFTATSAQYKIYYRYKKFDTYSKETLLPDSIVHGYLGETQFDASGNPIGSTRTTYTGGTITLLENAGSYANVINTLSTGDIAGVEYLPLSNATPVIDFVVGTRKNYVVISNDNDESIGDGPGPTFTLSSNLYLNFRTDLPGNGVPKNGNEFFLRFYGSYNLNGFSIILTQNYISPISPGNLLYSITSAQDQLQILNDNLCFRVKYDGVQWIPPIPLIHVNSTITGGQWVSTALATTDVGNSSFTHPVSIGTSTINYRIGARETFINIRAQAIVFGGTPSEVQIVIPAAIRNIINQELGAGVYGIIGIVNSSAGTTVPCYVIYDGTSKLKFESAGFGANTLNLLSCDIVSRFIS